MDGVCVELAIDGSLVNGARDRRIDEFTTVGDNETKYDWSPQCYTQAYTDTVFTYCGQLLTYVQYVHVAA